MLHEDGRLRLVDFDEAANTDPLFDFAVTLNEILSFESEWPGALEMAQGRVNRRRPQSLPPVRVRRRSSLGLVGPVDGRRFAAP